LGRIPEQTINEIRSRVDIVDLIGRTVDLRKAGRNWKGRCPFHDEKTPSFNVNPEREIFHCFGCQEGGDAIAFLMKHDNLSFPEAARALAHEHGIEIPETGGGSDRGISEQIFAANRVAQGVYERLLASPEGAEARRYLEGRGLDSEATAAHGVGFVPDRWDSVKLALEREKIRPEVGEQAGLLARKRSFYDRLRGRVTFPIHDVRGRIVGFGGRALGVDQEPKYLNTPESPVYRKREALYGFPDALSAIRKAERAVLCEGYFDRIALARAGLCEALATCGTALTREHAKNLARRTRNVVLLLDGDSAGRAAAEKALDVLLPEGLRVQIASLPPGDDPDSLLLAKGPDALVDLVENAADALDEVMSRALAEGHATPAAKADAVARVAPLVAKVRNPVERDSYARRLALATDTDPGAVASVVREAGREARGDTRERLPGHLAGGPPADDAVPVRRNETHLDRHARELALMVYRQPRRASEVLPDDLASLMPESEWRELVIRMLAAGDEGMVGPDGSLDHFRLEAELSDGLRKQLGELAVDERFLGEIPAEQVLADLVGHFERAQERLRARELNRLMSDPAQDHMDILRQKNEALQRRKQSRLEPRREGPRAAAPPSNVPPGGGVAP